MCGITGIFAFNQIGSFYMVNLSKSVERLAKRGPDGRGIFLEDFIGLGHRRLSVIDTSYLGNQPMKDESGRYVIVFNGEIFNFKELKKKLIDKGISFSSESDTEVLLKLYIHEGKRCLDQLIGFFAFAIYDKEEKKLFVARDRMGVKPLVFYHDEDKFIFSSELKALMSYNIPQELDYDSLYSYLQLNYIPGPATIYKNVTKLKPGHYLTVTKKKVEEGIYYTIPYDEQTTGNNPLSYDQQKEKLIELLDDSVRKRLIADVPLGAFLSGGIDSSVVVALASRYTDQLNTFSIGYKDEPFFDETRYANSVAEKFNTNHTVFSLTNDDLFDNLFETLDYLDEPFADSSALPMYILSRNTSRQVKVALSGDGADEMFAGYNKHMGELRIREGGLIVELISALHPLWKMLPQSRNGFLANKIRQLNKLAESKKLNAKERYWRGCTVRTENNVNKLLSEKSIQGLAAAEYDNRKRDLLKYITASGDFNEVLRTDMELVLAHDMLFKVDMMSMANGLEVRSPFLDHRVVDFAFSLPASSKIDPKIKKKLVQDTFREILPPELYKRPKQGFDVPLSSWYKKELRRFLKEEIFDEDFINEQNIFDLKEMRRIKENIFSGNSFDQEQVWGIIVFQYWWKKNYTVNK